MTTQTWRLPGYLIISPNKDAHTTRTSPRRSTKMPCHRLYSTSAASRLLLFSGHGPRTLREPGPNRLGHGASPRRRATRHPLDVHKAREVAYGALLSDGSCELPAPAAAAASPEDTGYFESRVSTWVTWYSCCAEDGRHPAVFLVSIRNRPTKIPAPWFRRGASSSPFLLKLFFTYRICYLSFMFYTLARFLASIHHNIIIFSGTARGSKMWLPRGRTDTPLAQWVP